MGRRTAIRERREQRKRQRQWVVVLAVTGVALVVVALLILQNNQPAGSIATPAPATYPQADGHAMGDPSAPVVITEYSDFQCPFCRRFHDETLPLLVRDYVAQGTVYFTYRHFPVVDGGLGGESHRAANAAVCAARQNRFWEYHDILFANQTGENIGNFTANRLTAMAETIGMDMAAFEECLASGTADDEVEIDKASAIDLGMNSTPSFVINGQVVTGAQPYEVFQSAIEAALTQPAP